MYCPVCFNDTLKIASAGVVRVTFNKKSRDTSRFFYDLKGDRPDEIREKFKKVVKDYFNWYSNFQNKDTVSEIELTTTDFICSRGCKMTVNHQMTAVDLVLTKEEINSIACEMGERYKLRVELK